MALKLDPFAQRKLLDLAELDRVIGTNQHIRRTHPALAVVKAGEDRSTAVRRDVVLAETEVSDLNRATNRLDMEVEQVRARAARDQVRLQSGQASPKELENLQHEIESLKRRQGVLEDEELELMEQKENADGRLAQARAALAELESGVQSAEAERDAAFGEIDAAIATAQATRETLVKALPSDVLALYTRIRDSGKVAAGDLIGNRCGACKLDIDRTALAEIRAAPVDAIVRCSECGAILVRA